MGRIKSALELALERTESVKSDKSSIDQFETKQRGKRLANAFLEANAGNAASGSMEGGGEKIPNLEQEIKKTAKEQQAALKQGLFDVFLSQLNLPVSPDDQKRIDAAGRGLQTVIGDSRWNALFKQLGQYLGRYLEEGRQYEAALKQQYAPKLRQKEEELARRLGQQVKLDPFQDPEFVAFYNQNMNALKENYQQVIDQTREQAELLFQGKAG
ncbi:MAG: hypothetical protein LBT16_13625 [Treponema sp.]|jgi:ABC-type Fe3+-hydroxamate transport system substrate-binding protein|nr:hypothetical protein [Treponema sp.]